MDKCGNFFAQNQEIKYTENRSNVTKYSEEMAEDCMNFQEQLDAYMEKLHCTGRELASESGVSETIISRYRKGERVPAADSTYLLRLAEGIAQLAAK